MSRRSTEETHNQDELQRLMASNDSDVDGHLLNSPQRDSPLELESKGSRSVPSAASQSFSISPAYLEKRHQSQDGSSLKLSLSIPNSCTVPNNQRRLNVNGEDCSPEVRNPLQSTNVANEWVWFPEGFWAELNVEDLFRLRERFKRLVLRGRIFSGLKYGNSSTTTAPRNVGSAPEEAAYMPEISVAAEHDSAYTNVMPVLSESESGSVRSSQKSHRQLRGLSYISSDHPSYLSPFCSTEGLYRKAKRGIEDGLKKKREKPILGSEYLRSQMTETFQRITSASEQAQQHRRLGREPQFAPEDLDLSLDLARVRDSRRKLGIAPWHRKRSQDTMLSATSTIRDVLRSNTPISTPNPEMEFQDYEGNKYSKVDITNSDDPSFLPSEARRVHTPPTGNVVNGRTRNFFFDFSPFNNEDDVSYISERPVVSPTISRGAIKTYTAPPTTREWWDVKDDELTAAITGLCCSAFDAETLEHLPSSPLCPANPKNKSGGNGICVYHGGSSKVKLGLVVTVAETTVSEL